MKSTPLTIPEVSLFEPKIFGNDRGLFCESFNQRKFEKAARNSLINAEVFA